MSLDPDQLIEVRARQRARAKVTALALGGLVVLIFLIALVRIQAGG